MQLLKSEVVNTLHFQLCSAHYTGLQINNSTSAINPVTMETWTNRLISIIMSRHSKVNNKSYSQWSFQAGVSETEVVDQNKEWVYSQKEILAVKVTQ